jgi:hypothetical protein
MSDGANLGIRAEDAMKKIVGGKEIESKPLSMEELEKLIRSRPLPPGPLEFDYSVCSEAIAHCFLVLEDEDPGILDRREHYPDDSEYRELRGKPRDPTNAAWEAAKKKWPSFADDSYAGGASGFMVGWALNAARNIKGYGQTGNPAILTIG